MNWLKELQGYALMGGIVAGAGLALWWANRRRTEGLNETERLMALYQQERARVVPPVGPDGMVAQIWFPPFEEWLQQRQTGLRGAPHTGMLYETPWEQVEGPAWMY